MLHTPTVRVPLFEIMFILFRANRELLCALQ
jgi:hypothetical protein